MTLTHENLGKGDAALTGQFTWVILLCTAILVLLPSPVWAIDTPMGYVLCQVVGFFYGNLGRGLATMAVIVVGIGATLGKVSWGLAITVAVGISVIFSAPNILRLVTGLPANFLFCGL
jgi:type IV secretory pathway VirB2 component (pilin)